MSDPYEQQSSAEEDTYRISAPEITSRPTAESASHLAEADSQDANSADAAVPRKRRKKRREATRPDPPTAPSDQADGADTARPIEDRLADWKADTGWREPTVVSAIWYPITGSGWRLVSFYAGLLWLGRIIPFVGVLLSLFAMIFIAVLLLESANYVLEEIPGGPQSPEWLSWSAISAGLMGLVAFLISGAPLLIGLVIMLKLGGVNPFAQLLLMAVSLFYLPMAFVALADRQNESALNPLLVADGIRKLLFPYLIACGIAAAVFVIPTAIVLVMDVHPFASQIVMSLLLVYTATALIRAVALLAKRNGVTFAEFEEEQAEDEARDSSDVREV